MGGTAGGRDGTHVLVGWQIVPDQQQQERQIVTTQAVTQSIPIGFTVASVQICRRYLRVIDTFGYLGVHLFAC
jgi:hypothetical protein